MEVLTIKLKRLGNKREEVSVVGFISPAEIQDPTILAQINS
ncbi:hypothetical protein [Cellulophaga sp. HaHa_2_1]|nr:hypothetical protein [Cellulophaga sp. HaHa_2_1]